MNQNQNELQHHGILGMKWGVRRYQNKDGSLTSAGKKRQMSQDAEEASKIKKKKVKEMSNAELRKLTERQNLERNYKSLNPNIISNGKKFVSRVADGILIVGSIEVGKKFYQNVLNKAIDKKIKNK